MKKRKKQQRPPTARSSRQTQPAAVRVTAEVAWEEVFAHRRIPIPPWSIEIRAPGENTDFKPLQFCGGDTVYAGELPDGSEELRWLLTRQQEICGRLARAVIPPLEPAALRNFDRPIVGCADGEQVLDFGLVRMRRKDSSNEGYTSAVWKEQRSAHHLVATGGSSQIEFALDIGFDQLLDRAMQVVEDESAPEFARHLASCLATMICVYQTSGQQSYPLRETLSFIIGALNERLQIAQVQHLALQGKKHAAARKKGAANHRPSGRWDARCTLFKQLQRKSPAAKTWDICRQIAEKEIGDLVPGTDLETWQKQIASRQKTINRDINTQLSRRAM